MAKQNKRTELGASASGKVARGRAAILKMQRGETAMSEAVKVKVKAKFRDVLKVKFGGVVISGAALPAEEIEKNIARSTQALERLGSGNLGPGVVLPKTKGVPLYSAAEGEQGVFIRRLNGRVERGRLVNGAFEVLK